MTLSRAPAHARAPLTLLYDGDCPICQRQVAWIRRRPYRERIRCVDIRAEGFSAAAWGRDWEELLGRMFARDGEGNWFAGMDAVRAMLALLGYRRLVWLSHLPGFRSLLDRLYLAVARHRFALGRWLPPLR
ncbi:thiol-disulfide oxidoreductase DCC family protein [Modicisalibacter radicis]|uniref:thiol-disulfide oxidoreductase DCC family protein n=1 Tax=Halomonas sp. EAR18 TaxID=2518972 RepID=UPI00109D12B1|nr:DUF393 domain-containing protein [Halomonas sp. EAR18]